MTWPDGSYPAVNVFTRDSASMVRSVLPPRSLVYSFAIGLMIVSPFGSAAGKEMRCLDVSSPFSIVCTAGSETIGVIEEYLSRIPLGAKENVAMSV
jgi:hypothetical protein